RGRNRASPARRDRTLCRRQGGRRRVNCTCARAQSGKHIDRFEVSDWSCTRRRERGPGFRRQNFETASSTVRRWQKEKGGLSRTAGEVRTSTLWTRSGLIV